MKYNPNKEITIVTYADNGVASSVMTYGDDEINQYHYICAFDNEEYAKSFAKENIDQPVFFQTKKLVDLAKEMNSSIVWPGIVGVALVDKDGLVEHMDIDEFIKNVLKGSFKKNMSYGSNLVVNNKVPQVQEIDFNKKYFMMYNSNGHFMSSRTNDKKGKRRYWVIVATSKKILQDKADEFGIRKYNREIAQDTLSGILSRFLPGDDFDEAYDGIEYIDENGSKTITSRKIHEILADRQKMLYNLYLQNSTYLDENYFVSADKNNAAPTVSYEDDGEYLLVSQRMDTMLKALSLEGIDCNQLVFTNIMTLREIIEGCEMGNCDGIALCLDDNPDHIIYLTVDDVYDTALDGIGNEEEFDDEPYIVGNNEFMMTERYVLMHNNNYIVGSFTAGDTGEIVNVIMMADSEDLLIDGLKETGYVFDVDDEPVPIPTYSIFSEFRDGNLRNCDGAACFGNGDEFYVAPREIIIDTLEKWEDLTDQKSRRVDLDFEGFHYTAKNGSTMLAYTQPSGVAFVLVAKELKWIEKAIEELFGPQDDVEFLNNQTLEDVTEYALSNNMGLAMCDYTGVTFLEPKGLKRSLDDDS